MICIYMIHIGYTVSVLISKNIKLCQKYDKINNRWHVWMTCWYVTEAYMLIIKFVINGKLKENFEIFLKAQ